MSKPPNIEALSTIELRALVVNLLDQVSALGRVVADQRDEIARLKGLKGRPDIKPNVAPSGMEKASGPVDPPKPERRGGGPKTQRRVIHEDLVVKAAVPADRASRAMRTSWCRISCCGSTPCATAASGG